MSASLSPDVLIIGAGMAGVTSATLLAREGLKVTLVDRFPQYPACFKAEKIEDDQADLLRKFHLLGPLRPILTPIREILRVQEGRVLRRVYTEQYGMFYHDLVNATRAEMPASVDFRVDLVEEIHASAEAPAVTLASGAVVRPRLVVLACGTGAGTRAKLGIKQRMIRAEQSWAAGFNIARKDGSAFGFDSVTYYPNGNGAQIAFLTLFRLGRIMRANLFTYWKNGGRATRDLLQSPVESLERTLPGLSEFLGGYSVTSRIETARVDLYTTDTPKVPGVLLLADAFQSVCPITGTGLSKVLTDVDVLCEDCVPRWLATPGMPAEKLADYYQHPKKTAIDRHSLAGAEYARRMSLEGTLRWRMRRTQWHWENRMSELLDTFREPRRAAV